MRLICTGRKKTSSSRVSTVSDRRYIRLPEQPPGRGPNGRPFCRWCGKEVPVGRRTWCSQECVDDYLIRAGSGGVRSMVWKRDHGECAICGINVRQVAKSVNRQVRRHGRDRDWVRAIAAQLRLDAHRNPVGRMKLRGYKYPYVPRTLSIRRPTLRRQVERGRSIVLYLRDYAMWDADHIQPVIEGGGGCGLDNLRTLCVACHKAETAKLKRRLAAERKGVPPLLQLMGDTNH